MSKLIWIDGYEANVTQRLGSGQVSFEILRYLEKLDRQNEYLILLPSPPLDDLPRERLGWHYQILKPRRLWTRIALPLFYHRSKIKPDLFFSPTHYLPRFFPGKKVMMIFDLAFLRYPQMYLKSDLYKLINWTKVSARAALRIITISQSAKKDIIKNYQIDPEKIVVAYPGYDEKLFHPIHDEAKTRQVLAKYQIKGPYVIFVGTIQPRKNLKRLIEAFQKIENLQLVIVGKTTGEGRQAWMFEEIVKLPKELGIESKVNFTGFVPSSELPYLMSGALSFILPSLWEGFGIPVLEAMACGVPAVVSNVSSLPEVVGEAGLQVDPSSVDQIEQAIRLISSDQKLHAKLVKASLTQVEKFSWEKMAKIVIKVFEEVA